jgi:hypothetical protein
MVAPHVIIVLLMRTTSYWQVMTYYARVVAHGVIIVRSIATMRIPIM